MYYVYDDISNLNKYQYDKNIINNNYKSLLKDNDKKLYILSRVLLNKLFNEYYNINYYDLDIKYNKYGKPYTDNIYFNIAHSNNYACACISDNIIGIDIELVRDVDDNIINYVCTDKEINYVNTSKDKNKSFFTIFCLKEAYFKMIGTGIGNLKDIEFTFNNKNIICNKGNYNIIIDYSIDNYVICVIEE